MRIPKSYVLNKFYTYSYDPIFRKHDGTYNAGCPICKEGKSLGKKKRLFYYPDSNTFHCFNCSKTWSAYSWITTVCNFTKEEMDYEISSNEHSLDVEKNINYFTVNQKKVLPDLPYDSINLFDKTQQDFFNKNLYFKSALKYIKDRKLDVAINKPQNLFISLTDVIHKNRVCIPFYDLNKKIIFYQSRCLDDSIPRYLGKRGYEKSVFNIDNINPEIPYIFIFEGPIDSMFVKNGVSVAGLNITELQHKQFSLYPFHKKIWVLDNPKIDKTAEEKTKEFVYNKKYVFNWKSEMQYKDFNELAVKENINEIDYNIIINNLY